MADVLLQVSLALLAAALAAGFAVHTYFRQREHELILSRYLEGSLDFLAAEVGNAYEIFSHNWARCLAIIKSYRDVEQQFDLGELSKDFLELKSGKHNIVAHHRLHTLTGTNDYWVAYQHAMAYFTSANSILVKEIPEAIRVKRTTDRMATSHAQIAEDAFRHAKQQMDDAQRLHVPLISEFQALSVALESERYRFKELNRFREKQEVKSSLERVRELVARIEAEGGAQQGAEPDA